MSKAVKKKTESKVDDDVEWTKKEIEKFKQNMGNYVDEVIGDSKLNECEGVVPKLLKKALTELKKIKRMLIDIFNIQ